MTRATQLCAPMCIAFALFGYGVMHASAQDADPSVLYVPLIGITLVPDPLALPMGTGAATYKYAVKSFIEEVPLADVRVVDDSCASVTFTEGDDDDDSLLDFDETWRFSCTTTLSETTQSVATATGIANGITATHKAYATVIVGSSDPAPLVSIINITKVAYPLSLPEDGGKITFTYRVNNPGVVPLRDVNVTDDKCSAMSGRLGDRNGNDLLDVGEVWMYTCTVTLTQTTTNTVRVSAFANGLEATGYAILTVPVDAGAPPETVPSSPGTGSRTPSFILWGILAVALAALTVFLVIIRNTKVKKHTKILIIAAIVTGAAGAGWYFLSIPSPELEKSVDTVSDTVFGWKFPVAKFPLAGPGDVEIAYSDIRDPGGIPEGLPVRLKIPAIGVDSAIEDAHITADGRMDVPVGSVNVAWFALGPHPGREGSAVIGGHFGIRNGVPFVFYNLDKLKINDKIYVVNDRGENLGFVVRSIELFDRNADATRVFTSDDGIAHLNLITCEGAWNKVNNTYPTRLVIFTDAILAEDSAASDVLFRRTLRIGSQGSDVVDLQDFLEEKKFLTMPIGVSKGYYGRVTRDALAKYQTSNGLVSDGVFGPLTRSKVVLQRSLVAVKPTLPSTAMEEIPEESEAPPVTVSGSSPYGTLTEGLVTAFLLVSIVFVSFLSFKKQKRAS